MCPGRNRPSSQFLILIPSSNLIGWAVKYIDTIENPMDGGASDGGGVVAHYRGCRAPTDTICFSMRKHTGGRGFSFLCVC